MAGGLHIDFGDFVKAGLNVGIAIQELEKGIDLALDTNAKEIEGTAKRLAPKDEGLLAGQISAKTGGHLLQEIDVNTPYAAWVEFGTGKYAAAYVSSLPPEWQSYASQFKGKGGGNIDQFIERMVAWVLRKGLQTGGKRSKKGKDSAYSIAYVIVLRILQNGIRPHPFLYPAFAQQRAQIIADVENVIKSLKI